LLDETTGPAVAVSRRGVEAAWVLLSWRGSPLAVAVGVGLVRREIYDAAAIYLGGALWDKVRRRADSLGFCVFEKRPRPVEMSGKTDMDKVTVN
jgi:hypothetical protein